MTIAAILRDRPHDIVTIGDDALVRDAAALLARHRIGAVPVLTADAVVGVFSERDVVACLSRDGEGVLDRPVAELMTAPAITVTSDEAVLGALALMTARRVRHLPVVDAGRMVGFVSIGDLVKYRIDRIEAEAGALRDYIRQA